MWSGKIENCKTTTQYTKLRTQWYVRNYGYKDNIISISEESKNFYKDKTLLDRPAGYIWEDVYSSLFEEIDSPSSVGSRRETSDVGTSLSNSTFCVFPDS